MDGRPLPGSAAQQPSAPPRVGARRGLAVCAALALALIPLATAATASAAPGSVIWSHAWNAAHAGTVTDVQAAPAPAGGVYVAATFRHSGGALDVVLLRYASSRKRLWTAWYDGGRADRVSDLAVGADGSVTVCGTTAVAGGGDDWLVLQYRSDGSRRWVRRLGGASGRDDRAAAVAIDAKGNAVVAGTIVRRKTGVDWCTAKFAPNGFRRWRSILSTTGVGNDHPNAIDLTADGRIVVAGQFWSHTRAADAGVALFSAQGRLTWRKTWQGLGPSEDRLVDVVVGAASVTAVGETHGALGAGDGLALRYSLDGTLVWSLAVDGGADPSGLDRFRSVALDPSGNAVVGGSVTSASATGSDALVARFAANDGDQTGWWQLDAGPDDGVADVNVSGAGDVFAAGSLDPSAASQAVLTGLRPDFTTLWTPLVIDGAEGRSVALAGGGVYLAGVQGDDLLIAKVER